MLIHAAHAGLLKVGGKYKTEAGSFPADVAVSVMQADAALQLRSELRDGGTVLVAVLSATTVGPLRASAVLQAPGWAAAVRVRCRQTLLSGPAERPLTGCSAVLQVPVEVTAQVMSASKGTPALRPNVFLDKQSAEAETDLDA